MDFEIEIIKFLQSGRNQFFDISFQAISLLASFVGVVVFILFLLRYNAKMTLWFLIAYSMTALVISLCKVIVARARPFAVDEEIQLIGNISSDFSFPSGHTACAVSIAMFMGSFLFEKATTKMSKFWICTSLVLYVLLVMLSRMYLGAHYLTDVLVGAFVSGIICLCILSLTKFVRKDRGREHENKNGN